MFYKALGVGLSLFAEKSVYKYSHPGLSIFEGLVVNVSAKGVQIGQMHIVSALDS